MKNLYFGIFLGSMIGLAAANAKAELNFAEAQMQMQEQIKSTAKERFGMIEKKNKDYITKKEYESSTIGQNNMRSNLLFEDMDTDKDGKVTQEEYYNGLSVWNYKLIVRVAEAEKAKAEAAAKENKDQKTEKKAAQAENKK